MSEALVPKIVPEIVKNVQNSSDVETPESAGQGSYMSGSQSNQEMVMNDDLAGNENSWRIIKDKDNCV